MARKPHVAEAAAALATAGAVVVGGTLVRDRVASADGASRAYRLDDGEFVPDGIRRIARGQLASARDDLDGTPKRKLGDGVHEARKRVKRLRAALRLARGGIDGEVYTRENTALRDAARQLASARDAKVLVETLDGLTERFADELPPDRVERLHKVLETAHDRAAAPLHSDDGPVPAVIADLERAHARAAAWTFDAGDFDALSPGLRRIYRRGRRDYRATEADPSTENLHEWRKRVKDLWHAAQILRPAAPKRMKKLANRAHALADLLGDDHDLAMLREFVEVHPQLVDDDTREALLALVDRRRTALQRKALERGGRLYDRKPKRFVRDVEKRWRKRTAASPQPVAA